MPTLPTVTVTQAQADRMLAAYGDVAGYKRWLVESIKTYVVEQEAKKIQDAEYQRSLQFETDRRAQLDALAASLTVTTP